MLLGSVVLAFNLGITFESDFLSESTREAFASLTLAVLFASVGYFGVVAWSEIIGWLEPALTYGKPPLSSSAARGGGGDDDDGEDEKFEDKEFEWQTNAMFNLKQDELAKL